MANVAKKKLKDILKVNNEFGRIRTCIVGSVSNFRMPAKGVDLSFDVLCGGSNIKNDSSELFEDIDFNDVYPNEIMKLHQQSLDNIAKVLMENDVTVYRSYIEKDPEFNYHSGICPRDIMACADNNLIIAPTFFEMRRSEYEDRYKHLIDENFNHELNNIIDMRDEPLDYATDLNLSYDEPNGIYLYTNKKAIFDAANILNFGKNRLLYQISNSGNYKGMEELYKRLGYDYEIIPLEHLYYGAHIDSTMAILNHDLILFNADRVSLSKMKSIFSDYGYKNDNNYIPVVKDDLFDYGYKLNSISSLYTGMNLLSFDESTVVVEKNQKGLIKKLQNNGIKTLTVEMPYMRDFGGSIHCATLDLNRDEV